MPCNLLCSHEGGGVAGGVVAGVVGTVADVVGTVAGVVGAVAGVSSA